MASLFAEELAELKNMKPRVLLQNIINMAMVGLSALMFWKALMLVTGTESPVVVVLSGSMEPGFKRGDLLFLYNDATPVKVGDVVVYQVDDKPIPIVHRILRVHQNQDGTMEYLTKGDNNQVDDRGLYPVGQDWLRPDQIIGRARGFCPFVGRVTIIMTDYPKVKYALLLLLGYLAFHGKD
ncbi:putative Signal peptidase complex catalytic subunit sec11 [Paratrimastix pyriformis]|uniref:Signal peptidase complex catalytic subunit SEC11 n=1 Tax=Paratrimastix pyriformis TaxID=342808 RepID=A0ABQ8UXP8_9EUKA|nr:putative Signal peptidase complex catalytic subunit sec11 [Paratrimastix pyriformis]